MQEELGRSEMLELAWFLVTHGAMLMRGAARLYEWASCVSCDDCGRAKLVTAIPFLGYFLMLPPAGMKRAVFSLSVVVGGSSRVMARVLLVMSASECSHLDAPRRV